MDGLESKIMESMVLHIPRSGLVKQLESGGFSEEFIDKVDHVLEALNDGRTDWEIGKTVTAGLFGLPSFINLVIPYLAQFSDRIVDKLVQVDPLNRLAINVLSAASILVGLYALYWLDSVKSESRTYNSFLDDLTFYLNHGLSFNEEDLLSKYKL